MNKEQSEATLFIVDNSIAGWTGLEYLRQWSDLASGFDIATGFFEIGALLELDGKWQQLEKIRILMGDEMVERTKRALLEALRKRATSHLDNSIEEEKADNPFLSGVPAIVEALRSSRIECRIYNKEKFHAKAYITHAKFGIVGGQALVGSSNFTRPGLTENVELNIRTQNAPEVAELQQWYEEHWDEAIDVTEELAQLVERHIAQYTPFDVYSKALYELFHGHELTAGEWDETQSRMFKHLDLYQKEAYWTLMKIARQYGGAFLCDGVGLGKTFVGLMLIERLVLHENKRVVLFAPKASKDAVWEPHLRDWLGHIGGLGGGADFSNLAVFSHTDLSRGSDFPERFRRLTELADAVIIDEAHHFRNPGRRGPVEDEDSRSRYYRLFDLLNDSVRPKSLFMLTATPINNRLADLRHMTELFTRRDDAFFGRTLGVSNLTAHFNQMEKALQQRMGDPSVVQDEGLVSEAQDLLSGDVFFQSLVVQRSRAYARASQVQETGLAASFPDRRPPQVADYSVRKSYGKVLDLFEKAFEKQNPLFSLPIYYPLAYYIGSDDTIDPFEENRQRQVVGLIRTQFLKRFESSVYAFERSLNTLLKKLLAFVEVHSETEPERKRYDRWKRQNAEGLGYFPHRQQELWNDGNEEDADEDLVPGEFLEAVTKLSRDDYNVSEMLQETFLDLDQIVEFLDETRKFEPSKDDKLKKLVRLLRSKDVAGRKVLIFTEFADTARYVERELLAAHIDGVAELDSMSGVNRADVIRRFSPYYNGSSSSQLKGDGREEIRVLISTDVLSEGLNLQDATRLVNYDIHWNPVRLMQRIGRVDRRMNRRIEERLVSDHPEAASDRGKVAYWNFLPPDELNNLLSLYKTVTHKTLLISKTLGIEGRKLLTPEDDYDALRDFNAAYQGTKTPLEDIHLEYQALLQGDPALADRLNSLPGGVFSGRKRTSKGLAGVFFCYALPALDHDLGEFTLDAGSVRWYLYDVASDQVLESPGEIVDSVRSRPDTPRRVIMDQTTLVEVKGKVLAHIKNSYLKRLEVPLDAPEPQLRCWMELNA